MRTQSHCITDGPRNDGLSLPVVRRVNSFRNDPIVAGSIELRLARCESDIRAAQDLRYRVFYEEMGAIASPETIALKLDWDIFDDVADHLVVVDHALGGSVIGTYRLMRRRVAEVCGGYYSAREYDISKLTAFPGEIMELGRSCVDARYRTRATVMLLWQGIAAYTFRHDVQLMFGCASLPGSDPVQHVLALSHLHHNHRAPDVLCPRALDHHYVEMGELGSNRVDTRQAMAGLPPLIKGYLRIGGWVGDGAVIDQQFNTTDVCIVLHTSSVTNKYYRHYERTARAASLR
jgi:putative hemolysin